MVGRTHLDPVAGHFTLSVPCPAIHSRDVEATGHDSVQKSTGIPSQSTFKQVIFVFTCISAQWMAQAQLGMIIIPLYQVGGQVGTDNVGQLSWMAAAYGQVSASAK